MATIKTQVILNEKDLLDVICDYYKLDRQNAKIRISKFDGDNREPGYTSVVVEADPKP